MQAGKETERDERRNRHCHQNLPRQRELHHAPNFDAKPKQPMTLQSVHQRDHDQIGQHIGTDIDNQRFRRVRNQGADKKKQRCPEQRQRHIALSVPLFLNE